MNILTPQLLKIVFDYSNTKIDWPRSASTKSLEIAQKSFNAFTQMCQSLGLSEKEISQIEHFTANWKAILHFVSLNGNFMALRILIHQSGSRLGQQKEKECLAALFSRMNREQEQAKLRESAVIRTLKVFLRYEISLTSALFSKTLRTLAENGYLRTIKFLYGHYDKKIIGQSKISGRIKVGQRIIDQRTRLLHHAARGGQIRVIEWLRSKGQSDAAPVTLGEFKVCSMGLREAIENADPKQKPLVIRTLLQPMPGSAPSNVSDCDTFGNALHYAALPNSQTTLADLQELRRDPAYLTALQDRGPCGGMPLQVALLHNNKIVIKAFKLDLIH